MSWNSGVLVPNRGSNRSPGVEIPPPTFSTPAETFEKQPAPRDSLKCNGKPSKERIKQMKREKKKEEAEKAKATLAIESWLKRIGQPDLKNVDKDRYKISSPKKIDEPEVNNENRDKPGKEVRKSAEQCDATQKSKIERPVSPPKFIDWALGFSTFDGRFEPRDSMKCNGKRRYSQKVAESTKETRANAETAADRFVAYLDRIGPVGILKEYESNKAYLPPNVKCETGRRNADKNRYRDVMCLDTTRVVLKPKFCPYTADDGDYIHANWVRGDGLERKYIATQAPLPHTVEDFWRMVLQVEARIIICLGESGAKNDFGLSVFWGMDGRRQMRYGKVVVVIEDVTSYPKDGLRVYRIKVSLGSAGIGRSFELVHCPKWPDRRTASSDRCVMKTLERLKGACDGDIQDKHTDIRWRRDRKTARGRKTAVPLLHSVAGKTAVIQCLAGIDGTGTLIAVDMIVTRILNGDIVWVLDVFEELRGCRASAIQTSQQYLLVYATVFDYLREKFGADRYQAQYDKFKQLLEKMG